MASTPQRNLSIDVFRGLTLALMIVVNTPGSWGALYGPLAHAPWHGYTLTDLVFPTFLFVVGASLQLSMKKFAGQSESHFLRTVFKRGALIFVCGYLLSWFPFVNADFALIPIGETRIMGVLQRIGLCYVAAAIVVRYGGVRGALAFSALALLAYWALLAAFGDYTLAGNAARTLDLAVLGPSHLYQGEGIAFDPEGILSTLPAIVNVLGGYFAIRFLEQKGHTLQGVMVLAISAIACLVIAYAWDVALPINKKLWTGSYVFLSLGYDLLMLAALVWTIDVKGMRRGLHFPIVLGKNTLFIYVLSNVAVVVLNRIHAGAMPIYDWLYQNVFLSWTSARTASLLFALAFMFACWLVAYAMDRRGIYVKL